MKNPPRVRSWWALIASFSSYIISVNGKKSKEIHFFHGHFLITPVKDDVSWQPSAKGLPEGHESKQKSMGLKEIEVLLLTVVWIQDTQVGGLVPSLWHYQEVANPLGSRAHWKDTGAFPSVSLLYWDPYTWLPLKCAVVFYLWLPPWSTMLPSAGRGQETMNSNCKPRQHFLGYFVTGRKSDWHTTRTGSSLRDLLFWFLQTCLHPNSTPFQHEQRFICSLHFIYL